MLPSVMYGNSNTNKVYIKSLSILTNYLPWLSNGTKTPNFIHFTCNKLSLSEDWSIFECKWKFAWNTLCQWNYCVQQIDTWQFWNWLIHWHKPSRPHGYLYWVMGNMQGSGKMPKVQLPITTSLTYGKNENSNSNFPL